MPDDLLVSDQVTALSNSECWRQTEGQITCTNCHNPHQDAPRAVLVARSEKTCLKCHSESIMKHAGLCPVNRSTGCVGCHMPDSKKSAPFVIADHWIRVHSEQNVQLGQRLEAWRSQVPPKHLYLRMITVDDAAKAAAIREQLLSGGSFFALARANSMDRSTAVNGGYLGDLKASELDPDWSAAALTLEPGQLSEVIKDGNRYVVLQRMPRNFREDAEAMFDKAMDLRKQDKRQESASELLEALKVYPAFLRALTYLGVTYGEAGNPQTGSGILYSRGKIIRRKLARKWNWPVRSIPNTRNNEAGSGSRACETYHIQGQILSAVWIFVIGVMFAGLATADSPADWENRAEQLIRQGDKQGALDALAKAGEATPASAESEDRIGFLLAVLQQQNDAATHFQKALSLDSTYAPAHFHLGMAYWIAKNPDPALPELQQAAKLAPGVFDYRYHLGAAYLRVSDYGDAVAELKQAVSIDPSKAPTWDDLGHALQSTGDLAGAVDAYQHAVSLDPANDGAHNDYAYMLIETRQADRGIEEARKVLGHDPSSTAALMNIGYANLKKGDFDSAEQAYRQALALDPNSAAAHYDLGIALKMKDQLEPAGKEFAEASRIDPSLAEAHYSLGIAKWQLGDFPAAIEQMRAALSVRPDYAEAHYMLGIVLKQSGDLDAAIPELKEAIRLDPSTPGPYNTMGEILHIKGDKQGSEEAFATGARLKREKEGQLANSLEEGMRGGTIPKPIAGAPPR